MDSAQDDPVARGAAADTEALVGGAPAGIAARGWRQAPSRALLRLPIALACVGVPALLVHLGLARMLPSLGELDLLALATMASALAGGAGYRLYVRGIERRHVDELASAPAWRELGAGALLGAALFTAAVVVLALLGAYSFGGVGGVGSLPRQAAIAIGAAVFEELLFRGAVFRLVEQTLGSWTALAVSSLLFGLAHLGNPHAGAQAAVAVALEAGLLLGAAYVVTQRLWLPIGFHLAWNFTQGGIFGLAVSGVADDGLLKGTLGGPDWLSGGAFGVEASIVAIALCTATACGLLAIARRHGRLIAPCWRRGRAVGHAAAP